MSCTKTSKSRAMSTLSGSLSIVTGCMFSGKSERLLSAANECLPERRLVVGPMIDSRSITNGCAVVCRNGNIRSLDDAVSVCNLESLRSHTRYAQITHVFVDEAQFFNDLARDVLRMVHDDGKHVMIAGLISDWKCNTFGELSMLLPHASTMEIANGARCVVCGERALYTVTNIHEDSNQVCIGDSETYRAMCNLHYQQHMS